LDRSAPRGKPNPARPSPRRLPRPGRSEEGRTDGAPQHKPNPARQDRTPASPNDDFEDVRIDGAPSLRSSGWTGCRTPALGQKRSCPGRVDMASLRRFNDDGGRDLLRLNHQERLIVNGPRRLREVRWRSVEAIAVRMVELFSVRHSGTKCGQRSGVTAGSCCPTVVAC